MYFEKIQSIVSTKRVSLSHHGKVEKSLSRTIVSRGMSVNKFLYNICVYVYAHVYLKQEFTLFATSHLRSRLCPKSMPQAFGE